MRVLTCRNVHQALPNAIQLLQRYGVLRESRNGPVMVIQEGVTTVYERPTERVCFWPERDANPFFHLAEALWMLAGRNDIAFLTRYAKNMQSYSDDGITQHAAYGHRWRTALGEDQLVTIAAQLRANPDDRRAVLQMWMGEYDLGRVGKDIPCNLTATFQRDALDAGGALNLMVFCRSNDILWGAYGANAVHFSVLLEYMAAWIGCPVGRYTQVSVNWHGYVDTLRQVDSLPARAFDGPWAIPAPPSNPYVEGTARPVALLTPRTGEAPADAIRRFDAQLHEFLQMVDSGFTVGEAPSEDTPFFAVAYAVLRAHAYWRSLPAPERFERALATLAAVDQTADWVVAAREWLQRRQAAWEAKMMRQETQA